MTPRGLRRTGTGLLVGTALLAAAVVVWATVNGASAGFAAALALFVAWPLLSLLCWRKDIPGGAWGMLGLFALEGAFLGLGVGGLMLYGLFPYAAGNLAHRWAARASSPQTGTA